MIVPFAKLPHKRWHDKVEKKARLNLKFREKEEFEEEGEEEEEEESGEEEEDSSDSDASITLAEHIANLLPGDVVDGQPPKAADTSHLADLAPDKKRPDYFKYCKMCCAIISRMRARERERRKHHIYKEYEELLRKYDEKKKELVREAMQAHEDAIALEDYRRKLRIKRNSKKVSMLILLKVYVVCIMYR